MCCWSGSLQSCTSGNTRKSPGGRTEHQGAVPVPEDWTGWSDRRQTSNFLRKTGASSRRFAEITRREEEDLMLSNDVVMPV
jgi:hypothetical protein